MGRRALRKIDPLLDLSPYLKSLDQLEIPLDATALFGRTAPLELEVGSGKGMFLAAAACERTQHDFLGVEISRKYARFCAARLAKQNAGNAKIIHGDAQMLLSEKLPRESVIAAHIYFPDPWWKKRHRQRRVINEQSAGHLQRVLVPGGQLHFWTDVEEYFRSTLELLGKSTDLSGPFGVPEQSAEHDLDYLTHFERRMRLNGQPVYRVEFRKEM